MLTKGHLRKLVMSTAATASAIRPPIIDDSAASSEMDVHQFIAAFVRIRGVDRLQGALMTRCWLAADMGVPVASLDRLLRLLRRQGLIGLPDEHLITINDAEAMRSISLGLPAAGLRSAEQGADRIAQRC